MTTLTFEIDDEMMATLDRFAAAQGRPSSDLMREALADWLEEMALVESVTERDRDGSLPLSNADVWARLGMEN